MNTPSFKSFWIEKYATNRAYYEDELDPFDKWESCEDHGSIAQLFLDQGLSAWYGAAPDVIVAKFLDAAIQIVDRAVSEERFDNDRYSKRGFPKNRGRALRTRAYAKALLEETLVLGDLVNSSLDYEEWCNSFRRGDWDDQGQAEYLSGVRTALLSGNHDRFAALLSHKWPFNWHQEEVAIYRAMAEQFKHSAIEISPALTTRFRTLFDEYRNPDFKPEVFLEWVIVRFELGVMWCKFFAADREFSWRRVVDEVSA